MPIAGRRARLAIWFALALPPVGGCRWRAPAGHYQRDGLGFDHLAGWTVGKDTQKRARTVVVDGPDYSLLTISVFRPNVSISLESLADGLATERGEEIKNSLTIAGVNPATETEATPFAPTERIIAGMKVRGLEQHFTLKGAAIPVPHTHTVQLFIVELAGREVFFMDQVADEDRPKVDAGFQKIFDTITLSL